MLAYELDPSLLAPGIPQSAAWLELSDDVRNFVRQQTALSLNLDPLTAAPIAEANSTSDSERLKKLSEHADPSVRLTAAVGMGRVTNRDNLIWHKALLTDDYAPIRAIAAAGLDRTGYVDATVHPCTRNKLGAELLARSNKDKEPFPVIRSQAEKTYNHFRELGLFDARFLPVSEKCYPNPLPPWTPNTGTGAGGGQPPAADGQPPAKAGLATSTKVAIGVASVALLALGAVLVVRGRGRVS